MKSLKRFFLSDYCILILIIANALIIFIQEFEIKSHIFDYLEPVFTLLFIMELVVKIHEKGFSTYVSDRWNRFDFILILISIPSLAVIFYGDSAVQFNIFLTLRAFRVFKFFRLVRFFPHVSEMIVSVKRALKASYIVLAGFFILVFIVSVVSCSLYKNIAPEYFKNPLNALYSIFRLFSVEGWYEIPDLIASRSTPLISFFSKLYFTVLLLGGGILGLSLVNSIFVDAMVSDNTDELEKEVSRLSDKIETLTQKIEELNKTNNDSHQ
jgi:voltage-gated sodium channel